MHAALYLPVAAGLQNKEEEEMLIGWQGEVSQDSQHIQVRHAPVLPTWSHAEQSECSIPPGPGVAPLYLGLCLTAHRVSPCSMDHG